MKLCGRNPDSHSAKRSGRIVRFWREQCEQCTSLYRRHAERPGLYSHANTIILWELDYHLNGNKREMLKYMRLI